MLQTLEIALPFFALVACGWIAARTGRLAEGAVRGLNGFVLWFALPCMLFRFARTTPLGRLLDPLPLAVYGIAALAVTALALLLSERSLGWPDRAFGALVTAFPNSGFIGIPLLVALLGAPAAGPALASLVVDMVVTSSICIALSRLGGRHGDDRAGVARQAWRGIVANPLPWAIAAGAAAAALELRLPAPLDRTVKMLAQAASPAALFAVGALLAARTAGATTPRDVARLTALKLAVHPALVWAIGRTAIALGVPLAPFALEVLVLVAALPSAGNVPMLAERYGAEPARIARIVLATTVLAVATLPLATALLR